MELSIEEKINKLRKELADALGSAETDNEKCLVVWIIDVVDDLFPPNIKSIGE